MADFLDMQDDILDELLDMGALSRDQVKKAILRSIRQYERRGFWFTQETATFSTVTGQEYYGSAALSDIPNMLDIVSIKRSSETAILLGVTNSEIESLQSGSGNGTPCAFAYWDSQIRLYPIPVGVETMKVAYYKKLAELSADDDENGWTTFGEELIRQSAKRRLAQDILHADDVAVRCGTAEKMALDNLDEENRKRRSKKLLTVPVMPAMATAFDIVTGE